MNPHLIQVKDSLANYFLHPAKYFAKHFGYGRTSKRKHDQVWNALFPKSKKWLSVASKMGLIPAVVGHDLHKRYNGSGEPVYIALVTGDYSGELRKKRGLLLDCLDLDNDKRRFNRRSQEVVLKEFNITLNIEDAYLSPESIRINPKMIFSPHCLISAALFWKDYDLRIIGPDQVVGIGGRASNLDSVASFCAIELTHPKMAVIKGARWNQVFENPRYRVDVRPMEGTARFIRGWELARLGNATE